MARQNINYGSNENDGTGDKLRDAMRKVDENVKELYSRTGGDLTLTNVRISITGNVLGATGDTTITTNNAGNITLDAPVIMESNVVLTDGILKVNTNDFDTINCVLANGNVKIYGNTQIGTNAGDNTINLKSSIQGTILPTIGSTYDLGSTSKLWKDVYASTVYANTLATTNAAISGGTINNTEIGVNGEVEGKFSILRSTTDAFLGRLLIRDNTISNVLNNEDLAIRPFGTGNLLVNTRMVVGQADNPIGEALIKAVSTVDGYVQSVIQNLSNGSNSSADFFIPRDDGDDENNYLDLGMNSSTYSNLVDFPIHTPGSAYLYTSGCDFFFGTYDAYDLVIHAGHDMNYDGIAVRIKGDTAHIIMGPEDGSTVTVDTGELLQVNGSMRVAESAEFEDVVKLTPRTVASLGTAGTAGRIACVSDGASSLAWGATVTGGGTTNYTVFDNGTNWTVMGK